MGSTRVNVSIISTQKRLCDYMCCATGRATACYCYYFYYYCSPRLARKALLLLFVNCSSSSGNDFGEGSVFDVAKSGYGQSHERGRRFAFVLFSFVVVVVVIVFTIVSSMKRLSNGETVSGFSSRSSRSVNHRI